MTSRKLGTLPAAPTYDIKIPHGLPKLDGTLSRKQRVEVATDVLALLSAPSARTSSTTTASSGRNSVGGMRQ